MITAERLTALTTMGTTALAMTLNASGYKKASFKSAKFIGITNGGQFCYNVTYPNDAGTGDETGKVFVSYDQISNSTEAEY